VKANLMASQDDEAAPVASDLLIFVFGQAAERQQQFELAREEQRQQHAMAMQQMQQQQMFMAVLMRTLGGGAVPTAGIFPPATAAGVNLDLLPGALLCRVLLGLI
jgi:hypothetical protein